MAKKLTTKRKPAAKKKAPVKGKLKQKSAAKPATKSYGKKKKPGGYEPKHAGQFVGGVEFVNFGPRPATVTVQLNGANTGTATAPSGATSPVTSVVVVDSSDQSSIWSAQCSVPGSTTVTWTATGAGAMAVIVTKNSTGALSVVGRTGADCTGSNVGGTTT